MSDGTDKLCEWSDNVRHVGFGYSSGSRRASRITRKRKGVGNNALLGLGAFDKARCGVFICKYELRRHKYSMRESKLKEER